nr:MAG TPA: hypothetical protein [Caudoviricetes sp.]
MTLIIYFDIIKEICMDPKLPHAVSSAIGAFLF